MENFIESDDTKVKLAAAGALFFSKHGYYGATTEQIAKHCEIRKASLFHHYQSKEVLAVASINYIIFKCNNNLFSLCNTSGEISPAKLKNYIKLIGDFFAEHNYIFAPIVMSLENINNEFVKNAIERYFMEWLSFITSIIIGFCKNETIAIKIAKKTMGLIIGTHVMSNLWNPAFYPINIKERIKNLWDSELTIKYK